MLDTARHGAWRVEKRNHEENILSRRKYECPRNKYLDGVKLDFRKIYY
jgi:hypothetical protein